MSIVGSSDATKAEVTHSGVEGVLGKGSVYSETGRIAGMKSTNEGSRAGVARFGYGRPTRLTHDLFQPPDQVSLRSDR